MAIKIYDDTLLIKLGTNAYPKYLYDMRSEYSNVSFGYPSNEETIGLFGYAIVNLVKKPAGDVVEETAPELREDGEWYQVWTSRDFNEEELAMRLMWKKDMEKGKALSTYRIDLNNGILYSSGDKVGKVLMSFEDFSLIVVLGSVAERAVETDKIYYRFLDGHYANFTPSEFKVFKNYIEDVYYDLTKKYWNFLEAVNSAEKESDVPEAPQSFF